LLIIVATKQVKTNAENAHLILTVVTEHVKSGKTEDVLKMDFAIVMQLRMHVVIVRQILIVVTKVSAGQPKIQNV